MSAMLDVVLDVVIERERQKSSEGWTPEHDDEHRHGELALAASGYALRAAGRAGSAITPPHWPWDALWWKPTTARRDLVKAAALILAEIERIDRAAIDAAQSTEMKLTKEKAMQPHQQRVVDEKAELDARREKLTAFLAGDICRTLPAEEQHRLGRQATIMAQYSQILGERIDAF